jgi:GMP synthase-like glutamine amidotransferase
MRIGILETGEVHPDLLEKHGDYPRMFADLLGAVDPTLEFSTIRVVAGESPSDPHDADAWLITGSRHGVYDDLPWIGPLKDFVRACRAADVPMVGICFGHQILAEALGGRAEKSDKGWGLGVQSYEVVTKPGWMADMPDRFSVRALHQDQVVDLPPDATVLARSPHCEYAALAYGDPEAPDAITLQPHPEYGPEFFEALLTLRAGTVIPMDVADAARATLAVPVHSPDWARLIVDYLHRVAAARAEA